MVIERALNLIHLLAHAGRWMSRGKECLHRVVASAKQGAVCLMACHARRLLRMRHGRQGGAAQQQGGGPGHDSQLP